MTEPTSKDQTSATDLLRTVAIGATGLAVVIAGFAAFSQSGGTTDTVSPQTIAMSEGASFDLGDLTDAERAAFGAQVQAYLMENPQVIMDAVAVLEERQQAEAAQADVGLVATYADQIFNDGYSHISGNPKGDVTIVEFVDYRCGFCRRAHGDVQELVASDGNIRLITKEFPILGPNSLISAQFAVAVKQVAGGDAYEAANNALIQLNGEMTEAALRRLADTLEVDADAVLAAMQTDAVKAEIQQTRALAQSLNINGTPTFVMGTEMVRGYVPLDGMRDIVETLRDAG